MFEIIKSLLSKAWEIIKKFFLAIISFVKNIVSFFKDPFRLRKLQVDQNRLAVAIKEKLDNGDYQVVNCLFDKHTSTLVDPQQDSEVITSGELDQETKNKFGNKDMLVLQ